MRLASSGAGAVSDGGRGNANGKVSGSAPQRSRVRKFPRGGLGQYDLCAEGASYIATAGQIRERCASAHAFGSVFLRRLSRPLLYEHGRDQPQQQKQRIDIERDEKRHAEHQQRVVRAAPQCKHCHISCECAAERSRQQDFRFFRGGAAPLERTLAQRTDEYEAVDVYGKQIDSKKDIPQHSAIEYVSRPEF